MVEVYLDNERLEIPDTTSVGINVGISHIEDPISASGSYSQTIDVPMTPNNTAVFRHTEQILSPEIFNHTEHTAAVYEDGVELIKGKAYFEGATDTHYKLQIVGNDFSWVERIKDKKLNEIDNSTVSQFQEYAMQTDAERKAVFFALLNHGCWWQEVEDETIRRKWATYADLVPFVGLHTILQSIFKGYTLNTGTISELLTRLYVTGQWKAPENADVLAADNEWEISCTGANIIDITANGVTEAVVGTKVTADNHGNEAAYCNVFDTVETDPNNRIEVDTRDVTADGEDYTHKVLTFAPSEDAITAYRMRLRYTTQMVAKDNTPIFADTIHFGGMPVAQLGLEDSNALAGGMLNSDTLRSCKYPETLSKLTSGTTIPDSEKRYFYLKLSNPELYTAVVQVAVSINDKGQFYWYDKYIISTNVQSEMLIRGAMNFNYDTDKAFDYNNDHPEEGVRAAIGLLTNSGEVLIIGDNERANVRWTPYLANRGSLARGAVRIRKTTPHIQPYSDTVVQIWQIGDNDTLTFDAQLLTPAFNVSTKESADLSIGFTSSKATELESEELLVAVGDASLSPKFNGVLPFGYPISLNDVGGDVSATDMLKAIMHLFNLRIYTNDDTKVVYILPYSEFYTDKVVDWRNRIDQDKGVEIATIGDNIGNAVVLSYQEATPAVEYYNKRHNAPYLSWRTPLLSKRNNKEYGLENAVFTAPMEIDTAEIFPTTQWGGLLNMVDKETQDTLDNLDYGNIPQVLVQTQTPTADPSDYIQYVGSTGLLAEYLQPEFVITDIEANTNIAFDDRNGVAGLHQYYDKQVNAWNYGKRIVCYCHLYPQEIESLRKAGTSDVDFRSRFLLNIGGEDIHCRLESVENYEPQNITHKCTFVY